MEESRRKKNPFRTHSAESILFESLQFLPTCCLFIMTNKVLLIYAKATQQDFPV